MTCAIRDGDQQQPLYQGGEHRRRSGGEEREMNGQRKRRPGMPKLSACALRRGGSACYTLRSDVSQTTSLPRDPAADIRGRRRTQSGQRRRTNSGIFPGGPTVAPLQRGAGGATQIGFGGFVEQCAISVREERNERVKSLQ